MSELTLKVRFKYFGRLGFSVLVMLVAWVATWVPVIVVPTEGLDPSWMFALSDFRHSGAQWGRDVVFTYGPLGFLVAPNAAFPRLFAVAFVGRGVLLVAATVLIRKVRAGGLRVAGRSWPVDAFVAGVALSLFPYPPEAALALYGLGLYCLRQRLRKELRLGPWALVLVVLPAPVLTLVKFNIGVVAIVLLLVSQLAGSRSPRVWLARMAAVFLVICVEVVGLWVVSAQRIGNLPAFVSSSLRITAGYSLAMAVWAPSLGWLYYSIPLVLLIAGAVFVLRRGDGRGWLLVEGLAFGSSVYFAFRGGFTRLDRIHVATFLGAAGVALLPVICSSGHRVVDTWLRRIGPCVLIGSMAFSSSLVGVNPIVAVDLSKNAKGVGHQLALLASKAERVRALETVSRSRSVSLDQARAVVLRNSVRGSLAIEPWDYDFGWWFGLATRNPPVFQRYVAFTPWLDSLNADFYDGRNPPKFVLHALNNAIDGRSAAWQAPRTTVSLFCNYMVRDTEGPWVLLEQAEWQCRSSTRKFLTQRTGPDCLGTLKVNVVSDPLVTRVWSALVKPKAPPSASVGSVYKRLTAASWGAPLLYQTSGDTTDFPDIPLLVAVPRFNTGATDAPVVAFGTICRVKKL